MLFVAARTQRKIVNVDKAVTGHVTKTPRATAGKQELGTTATGTQQKRQRAHPEPSRKSRGIRQGCATKTTGGAAGT